MKHANLDAALRQLDPLACRADLGGRTLVLSSGGQAVSSAKRDEMLARCKAGEYVELDIEVLAYEQASGVQNRNFVRFRDGALMALGRSGAEKPFLRDHEQYDVNARAGTILESKTTKRDEGSYSIGMTVRLTAPWAVDLALRGLLSTVSIGWNSTGPIECSACSAPRFTKCYHWPGDRLKESTDSDGNPIKVRDRNGPIVVEWIYTAAELTECSVVSVPAVPGAHIEGIRAALAANPDFRALSAPDEDGFLEEQSQMKIMTALAAILSLAPTASEDDIVKGVESLKAENALAHKELALANKELEVLSGEKKKTDEDKFIGAEIARGALHLGIEQEVRELFRLGPAKARELAAKKADGSATPVGQPRQSGGADPSPKTDPAGGDLTAQVKAGLAAHGVDADEALRFAKMFGAKKPLEIIAGELGMKKGA